jgi:hypothetical protein
MATLKSIISETFATISPEEFFVKNNVDIENASFLGRGDFGEAYSLGDGRVLKKTTSKSEYEIALEIIEKGDIPALSGFAKIYKAEKIYHSYFILMEELENDSRIEDMFYELSSYLEEQGLPIQYLGHWDRDETDMEISEEMEKFIEDLYDIIYAYNYLGIEASDIKPDNMGYDKNGKVKAFDIDNRKK